MPRGRKKKIKDEDNKEVEEENKEEIEENKKNRGRKKKINDEENKEVINQEINQEQEQGLNQEPEQEKNIIVDNKLNNILKSIDKTNQLDEEDLKTSSDEETEEYDENEEDEDYDDESGEIDDIYSNEAEINEDEFYQNLTDEERQERRILLFKIKAYLNEFKSELKEFKYRDIYYLDNERLKNKIEEMEFLINMGNSKMLFKGIYFSTLQLSEDVAYHLLNYDYRGVTNILNKSSALDRCLTQLSIKYSDKFINNPMSELFLITAGSIVKQAQINNYKKQMFIKELEDKNISDDIKNNYSDL